MQKSLINTFDIKAIVGLGNPGPRFLFTPHNIGFLVVDALCDRYHGSWQSKQKMDIATVVINDQRIVLVKPQTFMNNSGEILSFLQKQGIKQENIMVVHDEIDQEFGILKWKDGGSARGHNGLRSFISYGGEKFLRLRFGVGRPADRSSVGNFVLQSFQQSDSEVAEKIDEAILMIESYMKE